MKALPYAFLAFAGVTVATVGTTAHRAFPWWGVAGAIALVLAASIYARTWKRFAGLTMFGIGWFAGAAVLALTGPGNSVLIESDAIGTAWLYGGAGAIVATSLIPRSLLEGRDVKE